MKHNTRLILMTKDLITIFTEYATILDAYFNNEQNKQEHYFLYEEYIELGKKLKKVGEKYK